MTVLFPVTSQGKALQTPGRHPLTVPTRALADAIAVEWETQKKFSPSNMPLTTLAYTAIDRIAGQEGSIVEALLAYVDTDALAYRASAEKLAQRQKQQWDPILDWAKKTFGATWQSASGVMPQDQSPALHQALQKYLKRLDAMQLAAACMLASGFSSLALAVAVLEKRLSAAEAFALSRLEEEFQAEAWGRDAEAARRAEDLQKEIVASGRFLGLLQAS